jgi:hypothetical protein
LPIGLPLTKAGIEALLVHDFERRRTEFARDEQPNGLGPDVDDCVDGPVSGLHEVALSYSALPQRRPTKAPSAANRRCRTGFNKMKSGVFAGGP